MSVFSYLYHMGLLFILFVKKMVKVKSCYSARVLDLVMAFEKDIFISDNAVLFFHKCNVKVFFIYNFIYYLNIIFPHHT